MRRRKKRKKGAHHYFLRIIEGHKKKNYWNFQKTLGIQNFQNFFFESLGFFQGFRIFFFQFLWNLIFFFFKSRIITRTLRNHLFYVQFSGDLVIFYAKSQKGQDSKKAVGPGVGMGKQWTRMSGVSALSLHSDTTLLLAQIRQAAVHFWCMWHKEGARDDEMH